MGTDDNPHIDEDECVETTSTDCPQGEGKHTKHGETKGDFVYSHINGRSDPRKPPSASRKASSVP